jgi:RHS repeat-associated protein
MALTRNTYQRNSSWNAPYTFSGKEKDAETGYGYFGARYYDSDLSIWLSVDPMAEKYPYQTNYVYCSNNPIRIIDPNGEDEYEFNQKGELLNIITNENADIIRVYQSDRRGNVKYRNGERILVAESEEFEAGSISTAFTGSFSGIGGTMIEMTEKGEKSRSEIFEFLAKNSRVEWATLTGCNSGEYLGLITTSSDRGKEVLSSKFMEGFFYNVNVTITEWSHSHFEGEIGIPSGYNPYKDNYLDGDHGVAIKYGSKFTNLNVYDTRSKLYYGFRNGTYENGRSKPN